MCVWECESKREREYVCVWECESKREREYVCVGGRDRDTQIICVGS